MKHYPIIINRMIAMSSRCSYAFIKMRHNNLKKKKSHRLLRLYKIFRSKSSWIVNINSGVRETELLSSFHTRVFTQMNVLIGEMQKNWQVDHLNRAWLALPLCVQSLWQAKLTQSWLVAPCLALFALTLQSSWIAFISSLKSHQSNLKPSQTVLCQDQMTRCFGLSPCQIKQSQDGTTASMTLFTYESQHPIRPISQRQRTGDVTLGRKIQKTISSMTSGPRRSMAVLQFCYTICLSLLTLIIGLNTGSLLAKTKSFNNRTNLSSPLPALALSK